METSSFWLTGGSLRKAVVVCSVTLVFGVACATVHPKPVTPIIKTGELVPVSPPTSSEEAPSEIPAVEPASPTLPIVPPGITLAMSSGGARSYCHAGVLKLLEEERIPIRSIVGVELGAVVGGLYTLSRSYNDAEWKIHQLKDEKLGGSSGFLSKLLSPRWRTRDFEASLEKAMKSRVAPHPRTRWGTILKRDGHWTYVERTPDLATLLQSVKDSITEGDEGLTGELPMGTTSGELEKAWTDARTSLGGPVVWVDCTPKGDDLTLKALKPEVVIVPDLKGMSAFEFQKKSEAKFKGKVAAQKALEEIREWAGP